MSAILNLHAEIARQRFLDLMSINSIDDPHEIARVAIADADAFVDEYAGRESALSATHEVKLKGCSKCYGSGGKANNPCKVCAGTGKVAA